MVNICRETKGWCGWKGQGVAFTTTLIALWSRCCVLGQDALRWLSVLGGLKQRANLVGKNLKSTGTLEHCKLVSRCSSFKSRSSYRNEKSADHPVLVSVWRCPGTGGEICTTTITNNSFILGINFYNQHKNTTILLLLHSNRWSGRHAKRS